MLENHAGFAYMVLCKDSSLKCDLKFGPGATVYTTQWYILVDSLPMNRSTWNGFRQR